MVSLDIALQSKFYANSPDKVLGPLSFSVSAGEFVALVGPSGAGKTTLLNMIAALQSSAPGEIKFNGRPLMGKPGCKIGYIFQQPRLMPWLTVADNLRLVKPDIHESDIGAILAKVGLEGKSLLYPKHLSGGMQRRVSIARAFLTEPDLLLLDEPFVSLDAPNADNLRSLLSELWVEQKPTVIFVTHDLNEAIQLADRILFLSAAPGMVILDQPVAIARPRLPDDSRLQRWKTDLLCDYSGLLEGVLSGPGLKSVSGGK
ncbi:ABC transporter ATP-binding protein [Amphritea pacifica]|uniref:ABC transporter ATP-binding protein n=1 Tax=Amphritea pacifica TaxID=2811233 RepID=A0ABS2W9D7_9GAMM|nr:ABC transporter ATP-binding protein [Amphritea pacifica]MBN0988338.1 ABC transporter ATP-binding protein [Amphritea pacifica]MBN1005551.1 ABC transporter ATP-binding protein [Amphritea pacifica]